MTAAIADEFVQIPMSPFLKATLVRAADYAAAQMHREVTLEHLLLALAEDPEASIVLKSSQVDIQRLMSDVSTFLGRIDDRVEASASPAELISGDLRRILEASAAAASQGRRREINGAIVLAAIVGDAKSPSAHMLRSQGLTFEQAIRALQQAASAAPAATRAPQGQPAPRAAPRAATADDVLASARERVATRLGPSESSLERTQPPRTPPAASPPPPQPAVGGAPPPAKKQAAPVDPIADRMSQPAPAPLEDTAKTAPPVPNVSAESAPSRTPNPVPFPQADAPGRPTPANAPPPPPVSPTFNPGWAPPSPATPAPALPAQVEQAQAQPARQNPFPPMNGMRPPVGNPAALPPFPPPQQPGYQQPSLDPRPLDPRSGFSPPPPPQPSGGRSPPSPAPWGEQPRGAHYDDAMARLDARRPGAPQQGQQQAPSAPAQRRPAAATSVQTGQLVENIPRKMRVGIPVIVEARVARADVKAIADGLQGDGAVYRHEVTVTKAMSVRLRAPNGGFTVESASPDTQWIENVQGLMSNDYASWRWSITPQLRGKRKLQLVISARTVGTNGLTAETALPDQVIDVSVGINYARTFAKWATWIVAAIAGGLLSQFGGSIFELAKSLMAGAV